MERLQLPCGVSRSYSARQCSSTRRASSTAKDRYWVKALTPEDGVERLDVGVVRRLAGPAEVEPNVVPVGPVVDRPRRELRAVVDREHVRDLAPPLPCSREDPDHVFAPEPATGNERHVLAREHVGHGQDPNDLATGERGSHSADPSERALGDGLCRDTAPRPHSCAAWAGGAWAEALPRGTAGTRASRSPARPPPKQRVESPVPVRPSKGPQAPRAAPSEPHRPPERCGTGPSVSRPRALCRPAARRPDPPCAHSRAARF